MKATLRGKYGFIFSSNYSTFMVVKHYETENVKKRSNIKSITQVYKETVDEKDGLIFL